MGKPLRCGDRKIKEKYWIELKKCQFITGIFLI